MDISILIILVLAYLWLEDFSATLSFEYSNNLIKKTENLLQSDNNLLFNIPICNLQTFDEAGDYLVIIESGYEKHLIFFFCFLNNVNYDPGGLWDDTYRIWVFD